MQKTTDLVIMKKNITTALRILAGLAFLYLGLSHFYYTTQMAFFVPLPKGSVYFVYLVGGLLTFSSLAVILNKGIRIAFLVIACVLALSAGFVQTGIEWRNPDEIIREVSFTNIAKMMLACFVFLMITLFSGKNKV